MSSGSSARVKNQLASLKHTFGEFEVVETETEVSREMYADCSRAASTGELGGARVFVQSEDNIAFLRYDSTPEVWDVPGGPTAHGESLPETAHRRTYDDTGMNCEITSISRVLCHTFSLVAGGNGITGLWVFFEAETDDTLIPGEDVREATWFEPENLPESIDQQISAQLTPQSET